MPSKQFQLDERTIITVHKRHSSRNVRLSITPKGLVRVSIPTWAPYKLGVEFAKSRSQWILAQSKPVTLLVHQQAIGKAHHLEFQAATISKPQARLKGSLVAVRYPNELTWDSPTVQTVAEAACERALRQQAEKLLPQRLSYLATQHGFSYNDVRVKLLKSRWGSCDSRKNIVLNLYLMQLPLECIDYVLLHELTHTKLLRHGHEFWAAMQTVLPNVQQLRRKMREYQPNVHGTTTTGMP